MKIAYLSFGLFAGFLSMMPAHAAVTVVGQGPAVDCFSAAATVTRSDRPLSDVLYRAAQASCTEALADKQAPKDRFATLVNRATLEGAAMETDASLADYNAALILKPGAADVYIDRGAALLRGGRYGESINDFNEALALGTDSAHLAYFDRGMAEEKSGRVGDAYSDYKHALALAPNFELAKLELSRFQVIDERVADR